MGLEMLVLPLRAIQAVFAIITLGLMADVVNSWWHPYSGWSPSSARFLVFASVWTILVLVYLIIAPLKFTGVAHKFAIVAIDLVTALFWFAGFIAWADPLGDVNCRGYRACQVGIAGDVFAAFEW